MHTALPNSEVLIWIRCLTDKMQNMKKAKITQIKSGIGRTQKQKDTLTALGFRRLNQTLEVELSPAVAGMVDKVKHLLRVEEL